MNRTRLLILAVSLGSALLMLGPALSPGLVQAYDLGWSPDPRLTPAVLGLDAPAPRVVPSDAVVVLLGKVLTAGVAQKLVLIGELVLASYGAVRMLSELLGRAPAALGIVASALAAQWNPYVVERLAMGQWTILWGYALIPWAWAAVLRLRRAGSLIPLLVVVGLAALGGANSWTLVVLALVPVLLWPPVAWRSLALVALTALGGGAAWWLPAVTAEVAGDPAGTAAFAARADSPYGLLGSLLSGGGIWSTSAVPPERASWLLAGAAVLLALAGITGLIRRARTEPAVRPLLLAGVLGLLLAAVSGWSPLRPVWEAVVGLPGGGLLRDGHKLVAPWVILLVVGLAVLADQWARHAAPDRTAAAYLVALAPVPLLLSATWGLSGRLDAVAVPADLRTAGRALSSAPEGSVGVLPWNQYRRYAWNEDRISLSIAGRLVDQRVLHDDALPLRDGRVAGERADSARVSAAIARGVAPATALQQAGARYLLIERRAGLSTPAPPAGAVVLQDSPHALVVDLTPAAPARQRAVSPMRTVSAGVSAGTLLALLGAAAHRRRHAYSASKT